MTTTMPEELLFEPDGHLTDAALACVADGELALVPEAAMGHLDGCDHCSHRLGEAALLSLYASAASELLRAPPLAAPIPLAVPAPSSGIRGVLQVSPHRDRPDRPDRGVWGVSPHRDQPDRPVAAIAAALAVAVVTAGPSLVVAIRALPGTIAGVVATVPFLVHVAAAFARAPWGAGGAALLVKCASALVLVTVGLQVARQSRWGLPPSSPRASRAPSTMGDPWQQGGG